MKLKRNDPCWCGSGQKYKKCHLYRSEEEPMKGWEVAKQMRTSFNKSECLIPSSYKNDECKGKIVRAHTVTKSVSLKKIARDGHVYSFINDESAYGDPQKALFNLELLGINKASTFNGFCAQHDRKIFSDIENKIFEAEEKQLFLISYRAAAREYFMKKASHSMQEETAGMDRGKTLESQMQYQSTVSLHNEGTDAGFNDAKYIKRMLDEYLVCENYTKIKFFRITLDGPPPIMAAGGILPIYDFKGNKLQNLEKLDALMHPLFCTSFYGGEFGEVVFTWLEESDHICAPFIQSLIDVPREKLTSAIIVFLVNSFENIFFEPDWIDAQSSETIESLTNMFITSVNAYEEIAKDYLSYSQWSFDSWNILELDSSLNEGDGHSVEKS